MLNLPLLFSEIYNHPFYANEKEPGQVVTKKTNKTSEIQSLELIKKMFDIAFRELNLGVICTESRAGKLILKLSHWCY